MQLHDGETVVMAYPIWTTRHQEYINSCIKLGYCQNDITKFTEELQRLDTDRVEDFHNYLNNTRTRRAS